MAGYFFGCPHCRAKLEARDASRAGRTVTCPKCNQALIIPPPPLMGVPLSQTDGSSLTSTSANDATQVVVSHDPGFKRSLSPAKAFGDASAPPPAPSHSGYDKLPIAESLQPPEANTLPASGDIDGYSFTIPDNDTDVAPPPAFVFKPKKKRSEAEEAPHPFEDPKNQLAALVAIVVVIAGISVLWSWLKSGDKPDKNKPAEATTPEAPPAPATPSNPSQSTAVPGLPGAAPVPEVPTSPADPNRLPGSSEPTPTPKPEPPPEPTAEPGTVLNVLPGADSSSQPGTTPPSTPESTPNVLPGTKP